MSPTPIAFYHESFGTTPGDLDKMQKERHTLFRTLAAGYVVPQVCVIGLAARGSMVTNVIDVGDESATEVSKTHPASMEMFWMMLLIWL